MAGIFNLVGVIFVLCVFVGALMGIVALIREWLRGPPA